jgi:general secretion pathway protein A
MYETQFGLNRRPFRALAKGSDVFVGPQTAAAMAGLKKALSAPDAIVSVSGPVGVGKTTIVRRALGAIGAQQVIVTIGRMQLDHDEMLELLLEEMGAELPSGTVQRFTAFRRLLKQHADEGTRVFFVVEDVARVGVDALSELEALTASDAGVSEGANVILMGDDGANEFLQAARLARLRQRLRLKQVIAPFGVSELMGYFKHCFRLAGKEFDTVFEDGCADVLHRFSGGIPRMANNLVESSLISAVENKLERVNVAQIKLVANEEYGLDLAQETSPPTAAPVATQGSVNELTPKPMPKPAPEVVAEEPVTESVPEVVAREPVPVVDGDEVPELIQDTLPNLEVLAPALARSAEPTPAAVDPEPTEVPELTLEQTEQALPTPSMSDEGVLAGDLQAAQVEAPEDEVPAWERDPTLAQLRPDLDALEHAMAVAQGLTPDSDSDAGAKSKAEDIPELVPEITLDREIQAKVDKASRIARAEEEKRAAIEAAKKAEEQPLLDDRPTAVILAEANARKEQAKAKAKAEKSVEAQLEAAALAASLADLQAKLNESSDTITDLPILQDMTTPAFEPAAHREPPAAAEPEPVAVAIPDTEPLPEPEPEPQPAPVAVSDPETIVEPPPAPEVLISPEEMENARKADAELEQIAANLAQAKTIDDCDDKMAETLFGEEFSMMAAAVAANAPPELFDNDDADEAKLDLEMEFEAEAEVEAGLDLEIEFEAEVEVEAEAEAEPPAFFDEFEGTPELNIELRTMANGVTGHMDLSASQRLRTVRALNAAPSAHESEPAAMPTASVEPPPAFEHPESIEDQINTSMTQTLKALSVRPPSVYDDDDDDGDKGGFFSRFKRS